MILGGAPLRDLFVVAVATALLWAALGRLDLLERYQRALQAQEGWQADELVFVLAGLALGLSWYALRRWREARIALALHRDSERRIGELLAHNRELAQQLIAAHDDERRALARELHDELAQSSTAIRAEAALIDRIGAADAAVVAAAQRIESLADALSHRVREMLRRLRPPELDALGLGGSIQALCEAWETRSGVACIFHHDAVAGDRGIGDALSVTIYRVVQEALANVMRHAAATRVRVTLRRDDDGAQPRLRLGVQDDGRGFDGMAASSGLGLLGVRERVALLGGEVEIVTSRGQGLKLQVLLPLAPAAQPEPASPAPAGAASTTAR